MIAAQLVHAAGETGPAAPGTHAVVLSAQSEAHLESLAIKLQMKGIPHKPIHEPDPPWFGQLMAIGIPPMDRAQLRKILNGLPLLKEKDK